MMSFLTTGLILAVLVAAVIVNKIRKLKDDTEEIEEPG